VIVLLLVLFDKHQSKVAHFFCGALAYGVFHALENKLVSDDIYSYTIYFNIALCAIFM